MNDTWTARPAQRIVSLLPSATEIVYALGIGSRLAGVTHECDFPADARTKPVLTASTLPAADSPGEIDRHVRASLHAGSSLYALDGALLERLDPDLILTQELCEVCAVSYEIVARAARRVRSDPRVVSLEPSSLDDCYANIVTVAELTGTQDAGVALVRALRARANALAEHVAGRPRPRVLLLEWTDPPMTPGHWTPGLIELAGGETLLGFPGADSRVTAWEAIAAADPDIAVIAPCGIDRAGAERAIEELARNATWAALRAVRAGNVWALDGNAYVNRPGPRLVDTAELFASAFFDEPYGAALTDPTSLRRNPGSRS